MPTFIGFCFEGTPEGKKFKVNGINVWDHPWKTNYRQVEVIDPFHKEKHNFTVFSIITDGGEMEFIAGEFSADAWGFYRGD